MPPRISPPRPRDALTSALRIAALRWLACLCQDGGGAPSEHLSIDDLQKSDKATPCGAGIAFPSLIAVP